MNEFKIGDKIEVLYNCTCKGHKQTIINIKNKNYPTYKTKCDCGRSDNWAHKESIKLITTSGKDVTITKTIMSKIKDFVKTLTLNADEKLMKKHGLRDENNQPTQEAIDATLLKLTLGDVMYHVKIATAMEDEEKAKCC